MPALPQPPTSPAAGADFCWPVRVYFEDTDCGGVVYHTGYLRFMERARTEWLRALGFDQGRLRAELGAAFAVRRLQADYRRPAVLDDELRVESRVQRRRRTALEFQQDVTRIRDAARLCRASVEVVCLDARTLRPRPLPPIFNGELPNVR